MLRWIFSAEHQLPMQDAFRAARFHADNEQIRLSDQLAGRGKARRGEASRHGAALIQPSRQPPPDSILLVREKVRTHAIALTGRNGIYVNVVIASDRPRLGIAAPPSFRSIGALAHISLRLGCRPEKLYLHTLSEVNPPTIPANNGTSRGTIGQGAFLVRPPFLPFGFTEKVKSLLKA